MNKTTETTRIIYSPSEFAKDNLLYLQEVGKTKALLKHTSTRERLDSFLFFIVLNGNGSFDYLNKEYKLSKGSCVFINCKNKYSHTSNNWTIKWIHLYGQNINEIYNKYLSRNGTPTFNSIYFDQYEMCIDNILNISSSDDYIKDMNIYKELATLLSIIMSETIYKETNKNHIYDIKQIKDYLDNNYLNSPTLDELSNKFFINKFYLTRLFKENYGATINSYINSKKITLSKELLRFTDDNIEDIAVKCGINDSNYFSRLFKQLEKETPNGYRKKW